MKSRWIPDDDLNAIMARLNSADRWIVRLLKQTGYRIDDVLHTRWWQWMGEQIEVKERKTGNIRRVAISPEIRRIVDQYRGCVSGVHPLRYFVPGRRGRPGDRAKVHRTTIWRHFQKAIREAGMSGKGYTLHSLRKCYAVDQLRKTGSYERVQADLGHRYLSTTLIYLQDALTLREPCNGFQNVAGKEEG